MMNEHDQWVTPLTYSSLICSYSCPDRYITSTSTFFRSSSSVPSTSSLLTKLAILSYSYLFSKIFLVSSVSSPVLLFTSMMRACPLSESMMKLQSFFSFLQISLASPTLMVSSQSLSFLARISVSFSFTSCFHCLSIALVRLSLKSPKLLLVLTRESLPFWDVLQLVLSYCCAACRERKLDILPSTFLHVYTLRSRVSRLTNSTHSLSNCCSSYALRIKPAFSASSMNSSRVRQSLLVRQNATRSILLWAAKSSSRWKSRSSPSVSSDIINLSINPTPTAIPCIYI